MPTSKKITAKRKSSKKMSSPRRSRKAVSSSKRVIFVFLGGAVALLFAVIGFKALDTTPCANSISCVKDLSGKYEYGVKVGMFDGKQIPIPSQKSLSYVAPARNVLGESTGPKKIAVDLSSQHLYAYEGDQVVMDFPVSTGKWHLTPTGTFTIWVKLRYTRMSGGSGADYYDLPNVPYTMFFSNNDIPKSDGYSIHGAYWHNNFGYPMSHGCVNMKIADAGQLFAWADPPGTEGTTYASSDHPGTEVVIYGTTPTN